MRCAPGGRPRSPRWCSLRARAVDGTDPPDDVERTGLAAGEETELSVLTYNIEYSGDRSTDAVIEDIDADVVGVLESYDRLPEIAEKTGYPYYNLGLQLLSKYPIHEPSGADGLYALIEVQPGYVVAMFNTHLDYVRYGPRLYLGGMPLADVLASEDEVRTRSIEVLTPSMQAPARGGLPGLPHRRPQPALEPGLHRGDRRHAEGRHGGDPVAGQRDAARHRHARHVPRDPPRPGREPRSHPRQPRLQGGRLRRPDRLPVRRAARRSRRPASSSARSVDRTSTASTNPGRPTTAPCCRRSR